uniref:NADH-ubiquinone oxidoreductase chain 5 n=1 Tax=Aphrodita australis TaxID=2715517 RepID=A0A6G7IX03_9ANNE|nr:NADH dehydrogenase subunit 5 [Aphrodita australis]QII43119.1 NADH dehydrogenase subunit 5 [Aphrodita australis]
MPFSSLLISKILWISSLPPLFLFMLLSNNNLTIFIEWTIMSSSSTKLSLPLIIDSHGTLFAFIVMFISANVMMFASEYMKNDPNIKRFTHLVVLFIMSMNFLIFIPNLMSLLLGWDGLGITSFILVIYYQNPKSLAAGMITALMNRVGDAMILLSIALLMTLGHWNIMSLWTMPQLPMFTAMILIAAMTKSAQIPFSSWLPAAMAAPTPVSALVHSSTLVTAGVFLLIRFYPTLSSIWWFNKTLLLVATITMLMAGSAAIFESDMKKIIALSTLSQLGVMMASLGMHLPKIATFHLITHALFKALLFVCAGSMIHFHSHSQDLRYMGNLSLSSPLTLSCMTTANLALCGAPFLAGFYSKDLILEYSLFDPTNLLILLMFFLATALTSSYSIRFLIATSWSSSNSAPFNYTSDNMQNITYPMIFLTLGAIMMGAILSWTSFSVIDEPLLPSLSKYAPVLTALIGLTMTAPLYTSNSMNMMKTQKMQMMNSMMWFLTPCSSQGIILYPMNASKMILQTLDQGWLEASLSQGPFSYIKNLANNLMSIQMNLTTTHLSLLLIFMIPTMIM